MENENMNPMPAPQMPPMQTGKPMGALIGSIIVITILVLGGFYLWSTKVQPRIEQTPEAGAPINPEEILATPDAEKAALETQGTSDSVADIEKDLNATDLGNLDKDLQAL